tara:strand:+ start:10358 stop:11956 length:1599 start_codon:yes stop_codon:yes gene_type:complete
MKNSIFAIFLFIIAQLSYAQTPTISFQETYGGDDYEGVKDLIQLSNGDLVICGFSKSNISGNKTDNGFGLEDYWILQIDSSGAIIWQTTIGGTGIDRANSILQTSDGGFLINGNSNSPASGNKTSPNNGDWDSWIVKLSATGVIEWQKSFGGQDPDYGISLVPSADGNYLICNTSQSGVSGSKTQPSKGGLDFWTIKISPSGTILDQKVYGGSGDEYVQSATVQGKKVILTGVSNSDTSGDKAQNSYGLFDIWTIIIDNSGTILNSSTEGGADFEGVKRVIYQNNELVLFGTSSSDISGSKTSVNYGWDDYWCVTLDTNLNRKRETVFGGLDTEANFGDVGGVYYSAIHQYVVAGSSLSDISGNKTIGSFDSNYGDLWMVGFDTLGDKQFEFVAGGDQQEVFGQIIETANNTLKVIGISHSGITGNKSVINKGLGDIWLIELDFNLSVETIVDNNQLQVYPNPTSRVLNFTLPMTVAQSQVTLTDVTGKEVYSKQLDLVLEHQINVSYMPKGIYVLSVTSKEFQYTRKVIID